MYYFKSTTNNYIYKSEQETEIKGMTLITESEYNELENANKLVIQKKARVSQLKKMLADTDYQAIKYAEGMLSASDYAEMKAQRQSWRNEINQLEQSLT